MCLKFKSEMFSEKSSTKSYKSSPSNLAQHSAHLAQYQVRFIIFGQPALTLIHRTVCYEIFLTEI